MKTAKPCLGAMKLGAWEALLSYIGEILHFEYILLNDLNETEL